MSLCKAAEQGNAELVTQLLQTGANINRPGGHAKNSPLHFAAIGGHGAVVELLLAHGADATQTDINGYTPLHCAAIFGHENVAALLAAVEGDIVGRPDDVRAQITWHEAKIKSPNCLRSRLMVRYSSVSC
eukprot:m.107600 g.107600  ORF g.107600 m.107600 type:complete len:130 (-) comp9226_c0_seq3:449-838(-)